MIIGAFIEGKFCSKDYNNISTQQKVAKYVPVLKSKIYCTKKGQTKPNQTGQKIESKLGVYEKPKKIFEKNFSTERDFFKRHFKRATPATLETSIAFVTTDAK